MTFTVPTEACQAQFIWNGGQAGFPCGFPALSASNIVVQYGSNVAPAATFTGAIAGNVLTVSNWAGGALAPGSIISGVGVPAGLQIEAFGSGNGQNGTYTINQSLNLAAEAMTAPAAPLTLSLGVHYTVALDPTTGNVTVNPLAMPDAGPGVVTVTRQTPATQGTQFANLESYQADALTNLFTAAMMAIAELKRRIIALEGAAFGPAFVPATSPGFTAGVRVQRAIRTAADLPITANDGIVNINAVTDLAISVPAAATRNGAPLTFKNLPGSHQQTLNRSGADLFDGVAALPLVGGASITLEPYNDGINNGLGYAVE